MAQVYTDSTGNQVYDNNGQTFNAKTGAVVSGTAQPPSPFTAPNSTYGVTNSPVVTPNPSGNLQNTLTTPQTPITPAPATSNGTTSTTAAPGTGLDSNSFSNLLGSLNTGLQQNNAIVDQKNAVVNAMLGNTIDPATLAKLPPDIQSVIQSGDRSALMIQANILNNALQGKNDDTANAIKYLSSDYQNSITQAATNKQNALDTLFKVAQNFVDPTTGTIDTSKMQSALSSLYPGVDLSGVISQLQGLTPTSTYTSQLHYGNGTDSNSAVDIPSGTIASRTNNPLNIKYSTTTASLGGQDSGISAQDGGTFASFDTPASGLQAAVNLLQSSTYSNLTVDQAMKKWSNNGYGAEVSPTIDGSQKMSDLSSDQLNQLVSDMATRESGATVVNTQDPTISSWVDQIAAGNATLTNVPSALRSKVAVALDNTPATTYSPLAGSRFTTEATKIAKNFIDLPQYQLTANGLPYLQRIAAAEKTPGSISDQELLDSITKLSTAGNAISDAQVKLVTDGQSLSDWASVIGNKLGNGGVLSDNQRTQIQSLSNEIYANYAKGYQPVYDQVTSQLKAAGIPQPFWSIPDLNDLAVKGGLTPGGSDTSTPSTLPTDVQNTLKSNITFSSDGKTAYLPRSVWSTLGANMDAVLAEAKNDGYTLLIK